MLQLIKQIQINALLFVIGRIGDTTTTLACFRIRDGFPAIGGQVQDISPQGHGHGLVVGVPPFPRFFVNDDLKVVHVHIGVVPEVIYNAFAKTICSLINVLNLAQMVGIAGGFVHVAPGIIPVLGVIPDHIGHNVDRRGVSRIVRVGIDFFKILCTGRWKNNQPEHENEYIFEFFHVISILETKVNFKTNTSARRQLVLLKAHP